MKLAGRYGLMALLAATEAGAQLPTVQVQLQIRDRIYSSEFPNRLAEAQKALAAPLIAELRDRIGFLQFSAEPQPFCLGILLGDRNAPPVREVGFTLSLGASCTPGAGSKSVVWPFRRSEDSLKPLSYLQSFADKVGDVNLVGGAGQPGELRRQFALGDFDRIVSDLLSVVPIAKEAKLFAGASPKWQIPLRRGDLCLDFPSRFLVAHLLDEDPAPEQLLLEVEVAGPPDGAPDALASPILARVPDTPAQPSVARLSEAGVRQVKVTGVFIRQYHRRSSCTDALPIDILSVTGGGQ